MTALLQRSTGEHVCALLENQVGALATWHGPVLANRDPEPLHQLRVTMRRLRVTLLQFEPLLEMPPALQQRALAKTARRLGLARDLDVLHGHLHDQLLPHLPAAELELLRPVLKQLKRERQQAHAQVNEQLKRSGYLAWLAQMQRWLRQPQLTPMAREPLAAGLVQWQLGWIAGVFVHPAWSLEVISDDGQREALHDLRKQIKRARYQLDNVKPLLGRGSRQWQGRLKQMQEQLGRLNDLQVLQGAIADQLAGSLADDLPQLHGLLLQQELQCWQRWRVLAVETGGMAAAQQLVGQLRRDRRSALLQRRCLQMCSGLQRAVSCDWRAPRAGR